MIDRKQFLLPLAVAALCALALYTLAAFAPAPLDTRQIFALTAGEINHVVPRVMLAVQLVLWLALMVLIVRVLGLLVFNLFWRLRHGQPAPRLLRDIFTIIAYVLIVASLLKYYFDLSLGALLSGSALLGVILGLALQDTLGNLFSGISLHADKPFDVGDVIKVGDWTGVVESVTWRAAKIRTFSNHLVLVSNSQIAKEMVEVCPRGNLNARIVYFNALYTDSPAKVIHVVREAVREAENVSPKLTPVVRIRDLAESGVDYECKYWLEDYARYNDTDALVRQRIWYAFQRAGLNFAYPTRTLLVERAAKTTRAASHDRLTERLAAVDIFAPLSPEELALLAKGAETHVYAPGETIIRRGAAADSMFVVHRGRVEVRVPSEDGREQRTVAALEEGNFFGEMALFTGEPRNANVMAAEETEVLEIGHRAMKHLFETNPELVEALSHIITERRAALLATAATRSVEEESAGLISAIRRFFKLS
ncbi:MAG TPA: mechanosensitive ion channel family protein [Pyrinomonadaceae bacterium]|jgi:small-conductance mechanosensitive channel/CRP-like cAMP-binding protein